MAAKAVAVSITPDLTALWQRFQMLVEHRVCEGNILAGERLWEILKSPGVGLGITIRSTRYASGSVECSLDPESGVLTCRAGVENRLEPLELRVLGAFVDCALGRAIDRILDELVGIEDRGAVAPVSPCNEE